MNPSSCGIDNTSHMPASFIISMTIKNNDIVFEASLQPIKDGYKIPVYNKPGSTWHIINDTPL